MVGLLRVVPDRRRHSLRQHIHDPVGKLRGVFCHALCADEVVQKTCGKRFVEHAEFDEFLDRVLELLGACVREGRADREVQRLLVSAPGQPWDVVDPEVAAGGEVQEVACKVADMGGRAQHRLGGHRHPRELGKEFHPLVVLRDACWGIHRIKRLHEVAVCIETGERRQGLVVLRSDLEIAWRMILPFVEPALLQP